MSLDIILYAEIDLGGAEPMRAECHSVNITHNLGPMAKAAGIYEAMWRCEDTPNASYMGDVLKVGLDKMEKNPKVYIDLNPANGWGDFYSFRNDVRDLLEACETYPWAKIEISR